MLFFGRSLARVKKRSFVVFGLTLLVTLLTAGLLALFIASLPSPDTLIRLSITDPGNRAEVLGAGVNLERVDTNNLITDGSFEPLVFRQALTVYDGDASTLTVSSEDASAGLYGDGFFNGATARVLTQGASGLQLKKIARVTAYGINRVGVFQSVKLPADVPDNLQITGFVRRDQEALAIGRQGVIIRGVNSQTPMLAVSGLTSDLTGICASSAGYLVCSADGDLIYSTDGQFWSAWPVLDPHPLRAVAVADKDLYVAVGDGGYMLAGPGGQLTAAATVTSADLVDVAFGDGCFVAVGRQGTILCSATGTLWQPVNISGDLGDWQAIDFKEGRFTIAGQGGRVAISDDGRQFQMLNTRQTTDYLDVVMLTSQQLILLGADGSFAVSNDSGLTWLKSEIATGMTSQSIALAGKDKIISTDHAGRLGLAQLVAEISLDSPLNDGVYQPGDFLFLETTATEIPPAYLVADKDQPAFADRWDVYGPGQAFRDLDAGPADGGQAALQIMVPASKDTAVAATPTVVSQLLDPQLLQAQQQGDIYRLEFWMRQENLASRKVMVWMSGRFTSVGTTFNNVGNGWKKYACTLIIPRAAHKAGADTRLNIGFTGSGQVWLDRIYLGQSGRSPDELSADLTQIIKDIQPAVLRLGFLPIGQTRAAEYSWARLPGNETPSLQASGWQCIAGGSLAAALKLASQCQADPWLEIGPHVSEGEILSLIEYLAGPISEPYGQLRMAQGSVRPWTEQFNRIYLEFDDNSKLFQSDRLRADFVDLLIRTISDSPYYRAIRNQLVFVDGMAYDDGVILSSADYHASDMIGLTSANPLQSLTATFNDFYNQLPRNPDKPVQSWSELIRQATLQPIGTTAPSMAELVELQLHDLGINSSLANLSLVSPGSSAWRQQDMSAARVAAASQDSVPLQVTVLNTRTGQTTAAADAGLISSTGSQVAAATQAEGSETAPNIVNTLSAYAFRSKQELIVILANIGQETVTCQLSTSLPLRGAERAKYDKMGQLLSQNKLRRVQEKITVLPGGVVILRKTLDTEP